MHDGLRRQYLRAMGITVWERRDLPQRPAEAIDLPRNPAPVEEPGDIPDTRDTSAPAPAAPVAWDASSPDNIRRDVQTLPSAKAQRTQEENRPAPQSPGKAPAAVYNLAWDELRRAVKNCTACGLRAGCTQTVFGVGNTEADLLVIGEAPGADEDRQGEPFVGRAGQLLNAMLLAMGFRRQEVFIANVVKCRPPNNRDPKAEEVLQCEPYLLRQIELVRPRAILAVGRISAQHLLKTEITVGRLRGRVHAFGEDRIPLVVTYHPAYLLRSPEQKAKAWEDLQRVLSLLHGPLQ